MIKQIAFIQITFACTLCFSQNLNLEWVNSVDGIAGSIGYTILCEDQTGNIYAGGGYAGSADFDPGSSNYYLNSNGSGDIYIQKLDANENFIWAKSVGGAGWDNAYSITTDSVGNVYVVGRYQDSADFDPGSSTFYMSSNGDYEIFILKLSSAGNFIWAKSMGGIGHDMAHCIDIDKSGYLYVTGTFADSVDFDPGPSTSILKSNGWTDIFVLKMDGNGNLIWAKSLGGKEPDASLTIVVFGSDAVYLSGWYNDTVDFDPGVGDYKLISTHSIDGFILKLDGSGNFKWVRSIECTGLSECRSMVADEIGNVFISGNFSQSADFDPGSAVLNIASQGSYDIFVLKLSSGGNLMWARTLGGILDDEGLHISSDDSMHLYITGIFKGTADFDPDTSDYFLMSAGSWDVYALILDSTGSFENAASVGGLGNDFGHAVSADPGGNAVYITGNYSGIADFDPSSSTHNLTNGGPDAFNLKLSACGQVKGIHEIEACDSYTWINGITYTANNNSATYTSTNAKGCDSVSTLNLTINTVDASVAVSDSIITANDSGAIYQWLDCKNNYAPLSGDTGQSFTAKNNGEYAVTVTNNGCSDTSDCITISSIGIKTFSINDAVKIYPVPASDKLFILNKSQDIIRSILIYNLLGEMVQETHSKQAEVDVSDLNSGLYMIEFQLDSGNRFQMKFIKS